MVEFIQPERAVKRTKYDNKDFVEHDLLCAKFKLYFCDDISVAQLPPPSIPTFIHQFYPHAGDVLHELDECEFSMRIDSRTLDILFSGVAEGKALERTRLEALLSPILDKFPRECCHFEETSFREACKEEPLLARRTPIKGTDCYACTGGIQDDRLQRMNSRIQPLLLFFIDGASIIDASDPKWLLHFMQNPAGALIGFCSAYPFLRFPDKRRLRISQFFVLPPYQRQGHGSALYRTIMHTAMEETDVEEVTVEDPSEAYSDFRLVNDARMLQEGLQPKLTAIQREEVDHFVVFQKLAQDQRQLDPANEDFVRFRKQMKKHLLKRYPEINAAPKDEKFAILERLFDDETTRFRRILKL